MQDNVVIEGYGFPARIFHWLTFFAVAAAIVLGLAAEAAEGPQKGVLFFWHKSFGVTVLAIVALRVINRMLSRVPKLPAFTPPLERLAADIVHYALYWLLLIVPLLGWAGSSAYGRSPSFFGLFTLPPLLAENRNLGGAIMDVHVIAAFTLSGLIVVHVAAALFHALVRRDGILSRMITGTNTARWR